MKIINNLQDEAQPHGDGNGWYLVFAAWVIVVVATLGSLFMSEVMGIVPCELCWYQRVFAYSLVPVLLAGLLPLDRRVVRYALPLAVLGWMVAAYHLMLHTGIIPETLQPCGEGNACSVVDMELYGFVTIPMMSMLSFTMIIGLLLLLLKRTEP